MFEEMFSKETINTSDAIVHDGKVYISLNELLSICAGVASVMEHVQTIFPQLLPGTIWVLNVYRGVIDGLYARFAEELVPDSPGTLE